jgi:hypothetical protein
MFTLDFCSSRSNDLENLHSHLLGKSIDSTVTATMTHVEPKRIKRRLLATPPPADSLHRAKLINVALIPIYNHVFMALPVEPQQTAELYKEVLRVLRTKHVDGQTKQKRRLVVKKRLSAGLEMGGGTVLRLHFRAFFGSQIHALVFAVSRSCAPDSFVLTLSLSLFFALVPSQSYLYIHIARRG